MKDKYKALLKKQVQKLDAEDFDLEAWKGSTVSILSRIYPDHDAKLNQIEALHIDYSSWALRDAKSTYNPMESCKKRGRELIETTLDELELLGLPDTRTISQSLNIEEILENELKGSQFKAYKKLLEKGVTDQKQSEALNKLVASWDQKTIAKVLSIILEEGQ